MTACLPANGLFFLLPGIIMGALLVLVIVLRRLWLEADATADRLADALNDQFILMNERGVHWGWWDNHEPWSPATEVADCEDPSYTYSESNQEAS